MDTTGGALGIEVCGGCMESWHITKHLGLEGHRLVTYVVHIMGL